MSQKFIKDGQIYNKAITLITGDKTIITNNPDILLEHGYEIYVEPEPEEPTIEEKMNSEIEDMINSVNKQTDNKILNNFVWRENEFYLTIENQTNFANMYIAREFLTFPQTIKTKTGYLDIASIEDVQDFYLSAINFVKTNLESGWKEKQEKELEIRAKYANLI